MTNATTCSLPNCDKPSNRRGFCYGHYMKNWRYGTPTPTHPPRGKDITGQRFGMLVATEQAGLSAHGWSWTCICDCGNITTVLVGNLTPGNSTTCGDRSIHYRTDDAGYHAAHNRVRHERGRASSHRCVDCGGAAYHWSYNHQDPDERITDGDHRWPGMPYSLDTRYYEPRCASCHSTFDRDRGNRGGNEQLALIG